jgi:protein-tyrosine phosphatase
MVRVCFVCLGNICRSPTAEGVMRQRVREIGLDGRIEVESAGTADYHVGEAPDRRTVETAREHGITLNSRARQFVASDFDRCQYVIAMDASNATRLRTLARDGGEANRVRRLLEFASSSDVLDVPDPYYGGASGFETVFQLCDDGCQGLLRTIREEHAL